MFYFLDAVDEPALCRFCVISQEVRATSSVALLESRPLGRRPDPPIWSEEEPEHEGLPSTPFYDAYTEIDAALREVAPDHPLAVMARRLQTEAARRWKEGRVSEAVYIVQRLRAKLVDLGLAFPFPTITTPDPLGDPEPLISAPPAELIEILLAASREEADRPAGRFRASAPIAPGPA
ncbi:MAG TPA: hypothetical protein VMC82_04670 [Thermoplasmata archaeon]|nr:hypothetical protein [Thermoplasmata archaeon]